MTFSGEREPIRKRKPTWTRATKRHARVVKVTVSREARRLARWLELRGRQS